MWYPELIVVIKINGVKKDYKSVACGSLDGGERQWYNGFIPWRAHG